jgi:hypothetical protein
VSAKKIVRSSVNGSEKMIEKLCDSGALFGAGQCVRLSARGGKTYILTEKCDFWAKKLSGIK